MAEVLPFRGITYNRAIDPDLVVSAPYDVISPEEREIYKARHENNFVRLILGDEYPGDTEKNDRFTRAGAFIDEWLEKGILQEAPAPVFYMYQQRFARDGSPCVVNGFIGAVKLCDYSENVILPHENTLSRPKGALERTIECTRCNLDSVYGLYSDPGDVLGAVIRDCCRRAPDIAAHDIDGNGHNVWEISDPDLMGLISSFMADKQIAIADGHHRYETALKYRDMLRERGRATRASEYVMMTLVNVYEKDLTVLPTHRVVYGIHQQAADSLPEALSEQFTLIPVSREGLQAAMEGRHLGLVTPGGVFVLRKHPDTVPDIEASVYTRELELTLLHECILDRLLGIDRQKLARHTNVIYTRSAGEAFELVSSGKAQLAFICNEIPVKTILDIASAGEKMPQKATYFYPKLLSGMVIRSLK
ncbi:MAG: DUF1015 domain-containing protein [Abditibacteriota bacterium]|nr:DUF1015 domain-containing protein [Abditibacteriota bacterium]